MRVKTNWYYKNYRAMAQANSGPKPARANGSRLWPCETTGQGQLEPGQSRGFWAKPGQVQHYVCVYCDECIEAKTLRPSRVNPVLCETMSEPTEQSASVIGLRIICWL